MASIEGLRQILDVLGKKAQEASKDQVTFEVGFSAPYATRIHEDLEMHHRNGSAKYLEIPMRLHEKDMANLVEEAMLQGRTLNQALDQAGHYLLTEAQALVPVDTGFLRDSGYVKVN